MASPRVLKRSASEASIGSEGTLDYGTTQHDIDIRISTTDISRVIIVREVYLDGSTLKCRVAYPLGVWWKIEELQQEKELVSEFIGNHSDEVAEDLIHNEIDGSRPRDEFPAGIFVKEFKEVAMLDDELYIKVVPKVLLK
ncbi:hypothetical protein NKR23_g10462 [Pleurostoma richardsiae]|uniref:Uncharacterized protein n=1 Tax=Pleurostoma richardsiae TaxID=41990 RepID=A0AA38RCY6_9PEZI|nr:hypothetical protein NKR23_g10462 [Pleurostoma richardsiae]